MRKTILALAVAALCAMPTHAQKVYNEIMRLSKAGAADQNKTLDTRRIYQFKVDELNYMLMKTRELMPDSSMYMVDQQAYAMYEYVNLYVNTLSKSAKRKERDAVEELFKRASIANPRFRDTDTDLTLAYYRRDDYVIQFSLDTDWLKALEQVRKELAKE